MSALADRVGALTGAAAGAIEHLAGGDLSEVVKLVRPDGRVSVAKANPAAAVEAAMLRALAGAGVPAPIVEGEYDGILIMEHVASDGVFSPAAWRAIGTVLARLHAATGERYGWPVDYRIGSVELANAPARDWPAFWGGQRLAPTAAILDRPWRERVEAVLPRLPALLPADPPPALLHGDLWSGNILVAGGRVAALIDPACCHGHAEVDLAMLSLFDVPPDAFWTAYGGPDPGFEARRPAYQLFPALLHLRLFGPAYAPMVDRLLGEIEDQPASG